jgi:ADP-L-glycero-D-manno-heptose 6-epimerase
MVAITGAAGFIGSNLAIRLAEQGLDVLLVDHPLTDAKSANLVGLTGFRFMEHTPFLESLEAGRLRIEGVFHLGACSDTTETDWRFLWENNVEYSKRLWRWCARRDVPLVYASSAATYGDGSSGFDDSTSPRMLRPLNLYGRSKNDFDIWVAEQISQKRPSPPRWAGVKFFNVYGPREGHKRKMSSMVYHAYRQIRSKGEVSLFRSNSLRIRDGEQRRDFIYVEDCIDHMLWFWEHPHPGGLYNSGTGCARSFLDLVRAVFLALDREPAIRFIDIPPALATQYQNFTQATMEKLRSVGFPQSPTSLERGVGQYIAWLIEKRIQGDPA